MLIEILFCFSCAKSRNERVVGDVATLDFKIILYMEPLMSHVRKEMPMFYPETNPEDAGL